MASPKSIKVKTMPNVAKLFFLNGHPIDFLSAALVLNSSLNLLSLVTVGSIKYT